MKRLNIFAGHYGSGKTNIAVNFALKLREKGKDVTIADLDIVNPYFRTKDSAQRLAAAGIRLISSEYANSNADMPALPPDIYSVVDDVSRMAVLDIGGDDAGACALGRYSEKILAENDYDCFFVVNRFRPLTGDAESAVNVKSEIENSGKIKFTAIINNSNLGAATTAADLLSSVEYADEISALTGLPIRYTSVAENLLPELEGRIDNLFPLKLQEKIC